MIAASELIINSDGSAFHLHIRPEQLADIIVLVGDRARISMFRPHFEKIEYEGESREFAFITGTHKGKRMTALSTGIGIGSIDIVMTELDALANVDFNTREPKKEHRRLTIVRLGTCGAIQRENNLGDFILSHYSVGFDALMNWYEKYDEVTDQAIADAFVKYMDWPEILPVPYFIKASQKLINLFSDCTVKGMTIASPGFYGPQGRCVRLKPVIENLPDKVAGFKYDEWKITNFEMEGSGIAAFAKHLGHDAITVCCAIAHRTNKSANTDYKPRVARLVELVLDKLATL